MSRKTGVAPPPPPHFITYYFSLSSLGCGHTGLPEHSGSSPVSTPLQFHSFELEYPSLPVFMCFVSSPPLGLNSDVTFSLWSFLNILLKFVFPLLPFTPIFTGLLSCFILLHRTYFHLIDYVFGLFCCCRPFTPIRTEAPQGLDFHVFFTAIWPKCGSWFAPSKHLIYVYWMNNETDW